MSDKQLILRRLIVSAILIAGILAVSFSLAGVFARMRSEPKKTSEARPRTVVRVLSAKRGSYQERIIAYGRAAALRKTTVAAEVAGRVTNVSDMIRSGAKLNSTVDAVTLDAADFVQGEMSAKAQLARDDSRLQQAKTTLSSVSERLLKAKEEAQAAKGELDRLRELAKRSASSISEVDAQVSVFSRIQRTVLELEQAVRSAKSEIAQATANQTATKTLLTRAITQRKRAIIRAPWDGVVLQRRIDEGDRVAAGTALFDLVDPSVVEVSLFVGASYVGEVKVGSSVKLRRREDGPVIWDGEVVRVSPQVDGDTRTFAVYAEVKQKDLKGDLPPGSFVVAEVWGKLHTDVQVLPRTAFVGDKIFVASVPEVGAEKVKPKDSESMASTEAKTPSDADSASDAGGTNDHVVREREVVVERALFDVVLVKSGLKAGEKVVVTNLDQISSGSRVKIATEASPVKKPAAPQELR